MGPHALALARARARRRPARHLGRAPDNDGALGTLSPELDFGGEHGEQPREGAAAGRPAAPRRPAAARTASTPPRAAASAAVAGVPRRIRPRARLASILVAAVRRPRIAAIASNGISNTSWRRKDTPLAGVG